MKSRHYENRVKDIAFKAVKNDLLFDPPVGGEFKSFQHLSAIFSGFHTVPAGNRLNFLLPFCFKTKRKSPSGLRTMFESVQSLKMAGNFLVTNSLPTQNHIEPKLVISLQSNARNKSNLVATAWHKLRRIIVLENCLKEYKSVF